jgi:hypothetical protein
MIKGIPGIVNLGILLSLRSTGTRIEIVNFKLKLRWLIYWMKDKSRYQLPE